MAGRTGGRWDTRPAGRRANGVRRAGTPPTSASKPSGAGCFGGRGVRGSRALHSSHDPRQGAAGQAVAAPLITCVVDPPREDGNEVENPRRPTGAVTVRAACPVPGRTPE